VARAPRATCEKLSGMKDLSNTETARRVVSDPRFATKTERAGYRSTNWTRQHGTGRKSRLLDEQFCEQSPVIQVDMMPLRSGIREAALLCDKKCFPEQRSGRQHETSRDQAPNRRPP